MKEKNKPPAFQFYPKDWLSDADVICMTFAQKGAYITLICYCWLEGQLPNNDDYIRKLLGNVPKWKSLWNGIKHKFEVEGDFLVQPRLERERIKQFHYRKKKSEAGKKGMAKRWGKDSKVDNTVIDLLKTKNNSSFPSSIPYSSNKDIYTSFEQFWEAYPRKVGKKTAKILWEKINFDDGLLEKILLAVEKQKKSKQWEQKQFIPHPSTWLKQERWKDEVEDASSFRESLESI